MVNEEANVKANSSDGSAEVGIFMAAEGLGVLLWWYHKRLNGF